MLSKNIPFLITLFIITLFIPLSYAQTGPGGVGNAATLSIWLNPALETYGNGAAVPVLNDFSGNGNNYNAAGSPTFIAGGLGGNPVVRFTGSQSLSNNGPSNMNNMTSMSIFAVANHTGIATWQTLFAINYTENNEKINLHFAQNRFRSLIKRNGTGTIEHQSGVTTGFQILNSTWTSSNTRFRTSINNSTIATNNSATPITFTTAGLSRIGRNVANAAGSYSGDLAELIFYNTAVNTTQLNIINNYLAAKYGLAIANDLYAFQGTHPNEVAGIGRESLTDFHNDARGSGVVRINNPSSLGNGDYLLFGHDGGALAGTGTSTVTGISNEVARSWVADLTNGNVGTVTIAFDVTSFSLGPDPAEYRLLIDNDGVFGPGTVVSPVAPTGTTTITFAGVDLYGSGPYFKLGHTGTATLCSAFFPGDWDNGIIWSCPGFPDSTNNAEIDPGVTVTVTGDESVNDLTINGSLVLNAGTSLIIKGNLVVEAGATITADPTSTIIFRSNAGDQALDNNSGSNITFGNLLINNASGVDLNVTDYDITGGLSLIDGDLNVAGNLSFLSDATSTGHLRAINGNSVNAPSFTTERFMSGRDANWNDIATNGIATTVLDLDNEIFISGLIGGGDGSATSTTGGGFLSMWFFDNATAQYVAVTNAGDAMPLGRGYEIWLGDNLTTWNAKAWNFNGGALNQSTTPLVLGAGWNLVGNPLPGFLDFEQIAADHPQINGGEYWHYDANNSNYGTVSGAGSFVPPGQGFWLFNTSGFTLNLDPSVYLRNDLNNSTLFKFLNADKEEFKVSIKGTGENKTFGSAVYLRKDPQAFSGVDAMDIPPLKVPDSRAVRMWMDFYGQERMVNYVNTEEEHIEIPLHIESGLPGTFEMKFKGLEHFADYQCFNLLNESTGEQIEIYPEANYQFTIAEDLQPQTMKILISKKDYEDCLAPSTFADNEVRIFGFGKQINADFFLDRNAVADIQVLNGLGQVVMTKKSTVSYDRVTLDMSNAQSGLYFVTVNINGQTKTEKIVLQ
jgi:hypothetical protein